MCIGDNNAAHAADYLNDQLGSLWRISAECARNNTPGVKPNPDQQHSGALAEWHFGRQTTSSTGSSQEMMFHAQFGRPALAFLCNHEATLKLDVSGGHYNSDYTRASDLVTANSAQNVSISDPLKVEFRVPFTMNVIDGQFMNAKQEVNVFLFEFAKAQMVSAVSGEQEIDGPPRDAMRFYLAQYLHFLEDTHHNVYYSLPTFGLAEHSSLLIDFSSLVESLPEVPEVHGVPTAYIAKTLTRTWLKSAMLASGSQDLQPSDYGAASLAEYRSIWSIHDGDLRFHVRFNPPEIKPLCRDEVVLLLAVDEVAFYATDDFHAEPSHTFKGWNIALLLNLTHTKEQSGFNARFELDFENCQLLKQFSEFKGYNETNPGHVHCQTRLLDFLTGEYLNILESMGYHIIYRYDTRFPGSPGGLDKDEDIEAINPRSDDSDEFKSSVPWSGLGTDTSLCGFDIVSAFSQSSINRYLGWQCSTSPGSILVHWKQDEYCDVTFKPPAIRLLGGSRAIIYINLEAGFLKPFKNWNLWDEGDKLRFTDWRLAFEVDLTMTTHEDVLGTCPNWSQEFEKSPAYLHHGAAEKDFRHICVNLRSAKFAHESSRFDGLAMTQCRSSVDYLHSIVKYIRDFYFVEMIKCGYHVLHTIPIWRVASDDNDPASFLRITDVTHHVVTKEVAQTMQKTTQATESSIVVLGVTSGRLLPSTLPRSGWLARMGSAGTVGIPADAILEKLLLRLLSVVNAKTTLVPQFPTSGDSDLRVDIWPKDRENPGFSFESACEGVRRYKWEHKDLYKREHQGSQKTYLAVDCITENYVEIPTSFRYGGMEIKLYGRTAFSKTHHEQNLSSREEATWAASVTLRTDASGLHAEATGGFLEFSPQAPGYVSPAYQNDTGLRRYLPERIDLKDVAGAFKLFEGTWNSCYPGGASYCLINPVFSSSGDFFCELRAPWQSFAATVATSPTSPTGLRSPLRRGRQGLGVTRHTSNTESRGREQSESRSMHTFDYRTPSQAARGAPAHGYNLPSPQSEQPHDDADGTHGYSYANYYANDSQSRESSQAPPLKPFDAFASAHAAPHVHANRPQLGVRTNPPTRVNSPLSPSSHKYSGTTVYSQQHTAHDTQYQPPPGPPPANLGYAARPVPSQHRSAYLQTVGGSSRPRSHTPRLPPGADVSGMLHGAQGHLSAAYVQQRVVHQEPIVPQRTGQSQSGYFATQRVYVPHGGKETMVGYN